MKKRLLIMAIMTGMILFPSCSGKQGADSLDNTNETTAAVESETRTEETENAGNTDGQQNETDEDGNIVLNNLFGEQLTVEKTRDSVTSEEEAVEYARSIAEEANIDLSYTDNIEVAVIDDFSDADSYYVSAYENHSDHLVTIFDCRIKKDGSVEDFMYRDFFEEKQ